MADPVAWWRVDNTSPAVVMTLNLGIDPETAEARTLDITDTITIHMRKTGSAVISRACTIIDAAANKVKYKPADGDLVEAGELSVELDRTVGTDVETLPDDAALNYTFLIGAKLT